MARPAATFAAAGGIPAGSRLNAASAAQQAAASSALPSIQSPPPATGSALGPQTLFYQRIIVPANSTYPVQARGNYLYIEGIVYDTEQINLAGYLTPTIKPDTSNTVVPLVESWREVVFPEAYNFLEIKNPYTVSIVVTLWFGFGQVRRDRGRRLATINASPNPIPITAYAAKQYVGAGPLFFPFSTSPSTQRARIRRAILWFQNNASTTNADFTLYLGQNYNPANYVNGGNFLFTDFFGAERYYGTQIRFPSFSTGAAGDTSKVCEIAELEIDVSSPYDNGAFATYPDFQLVGALVANAAYTTIANEQITVRLELEYD